MTAGGPRGNEQIYLDGGTEALTIDDYVAVRAPLTVREMVGSPNTAAGAK